jgi:hypothetical protein
LAPIPPQRLVIGYSLAQQQSLDPIDVLDPLVGHRLALTATSAAVFFLWRRRPDHGADPRFAAFVRQQSAHQGFASILLVLARRRRREDAIEAESTTWLSTPSLCSTR